MKHLLLAGAALMALATGAQAATVTYDSLPASGSYFAPTATSSSGLNYEQGVTGSVDTLRQSPFSDATTPYDAVENGGFATFSAAAFGAVNNSFSFVWGTPDTYNKITFLDALGGEVGEALFGTGNGSGSFLATVTSDGAFSSVRFDSIGANAFELAAISPVPLPTTLPMFGGAVLLLGFVGYKKRKAAAQA